MLYPLTQIVCTDGSQYQQPGNHHNKVALAKEGQMIAKEEYIGNDKRKNEEECDQEERVGDFGLVIGN